MSRSLAIVRLSRRYLSTNSLAANPVAKSPAPPVLKSAVVKSGGSTFFQRLNAFLVGSAVGFGTAFFFIEQELQDSNKKFEVYIKKLESRISKLEG
jgi:hypothetical protein